MPVLLQTGRAWAIAPAKTILIRFLLDSGSQRSFVRQDIARTLKCPVRGTERLNLFTFGKTHLPSTITCERVAIMLRSQHNSNQTTIEALAVPEISAVTSPPADGAIIDIMRHRGMLPADECLGATTFQEDEISVLIGSDVYWDVATGQITRVSPRITAYLSADSEDPGPLTPSHFLLGKRATSLPQCFGAAMPQSTGVDYVIDKL
ncbi:hypothetical protein HPB50_019705 [Hyalomma asiaticum]|uniref:Uncharacterized protein n=1 Tax=Hyalomma asiaticum TaxID=266040 RepID=A0ACB7S6L3_HYAAI|nr:hypothetical protein HPB50_019705 [Hyalomma asiaticum]